MTDPCSTFPARGRRIMAGLLALVLTVTTVGLAGPSTAPAGAAIGDPASGSSLQLPPDAVVLHVDAAAATKVWPHTAVWPDGSTALPYPNISWGVEKAQALRKSGAAVRVIVAPGTYRETIKVGWAGDAAKPLVVEAATPGSVIVSGAEVEQRWSPVIGTTYVSAPWVHNWGLAPIPSSWGSTTVPYLVRRREAVFVDGAPLAQVASLTALTPGTFVVSEVSNRIVVAPPSGMSGLGGHLVEVASRDRTLLISGNARAVAVKGFVFQAGAPFLDKHMAYVSDSANVLIEGNTFRHSSWGGLGVCCTHGVTVRGNRSVDNGGNGIDTYRTHDAVIEGNLIARNNVRGSRNGFEGWSVAGSKNLLLHGAVFRGNTYDANLTRGLWFDTDVKNVLVDGDRSCGNRRDGLFIEAVQGPLTVRGSTFCGNGGAGIEVATSGDVHVEHSTLAGNADGQLVFAGNRTRSWTDHATNALISITDFADWTLADNTIASSGSAPLIYSPVIPIADWRRLLGAGELVAADNGFARPSVVDAIRLQAEAMSLDEWRSATGDAALVMEPASAG